MPWSGLMQADNSGAIALSATPAAPTPELMTDAFAVRSSWSILAPISTVALGLSAPAFVLGGILPADLDATMATSVGGSSRLTDDNSDMALRGNIARAEYGVTGAGIKIGILSDSFNLFGGMAADEADGNLPANVRILQEGPAGSHDEGRAMADLIHKVAPGAQIDFYSATASEAGFAAGIAALQAAGCNVIVDDVAYLDEPFFQDGGAVQAAVEKAVGAGVSYFTAASNEGDDYIQQSFVGMRVTLPGLAAAVTAQNFGSHSAPQDWTSVTVPTGGMLKLDMQWDQPFASIGSGHASANSLGMALYNGSGQLVAVACANMVGGNPDQVLTFTNTSSATSFRLVVFANGGSTLPGLFKIINYGNGSVGDGSVGGSGTVIGQEMVPGANTVGAVDWSATKQFGGSNTVESFSSVGTGEMLFNASGTRLATPESTAKVNFVAPDGSVTSVFAPFCGTSAAAPGAAAVAALMLQLDPRLTPAQVTHLLEESTAPVSGSVLAGGTGLIQADVAMKLTEQLLQLGSHG
jgi:hypothetical protein